MFLGVIHHFYIWKCSVMRKVMIHRKDIKLVHFRNQKMKLRNFNKKAVPNKFRKRH
ncbi:Protein CBG27210 [Caenorhabditis briggsae]|uniref:Protein CBG27210 n=1 Tax=Caenorhabditis briggsae TaxID=6238 RepID=B6IL40_CAEBR|nr:Protein CBG27210 [Caenorhabditis briggsae]CAS00673.1 Protein CBG27210 [Caenorhabditis briggsae]